MSYYKSGRLVLIVFGVSSVVVLLTGMWLFSLSATYFYWYAVPTFFAMIYFASSCEWWWGKALVRGNTVEASAFSNSH